MFNTSVTDYNESDLHNCPQVSSQVWHEHYGTALERTPPTGPRSPPRHAKGSACWSHKKLTNRLESFDFFLCRWKYVHLPFMSACLAGSWSVLYPNYWGFIRLFTKRLCWLSWCDREVAVFVATVAAAAAADDEKQRDLLWPNVFSSSILPPPFFCLFSLPVCSASFRTNWCCLCANLLSRNTP